MDRGDFLISLGAGGLAGVCVDLTLFPLDTVKTRLQSPQGFKKAGGFRGIYAGVPSAAIGSFPNAAAFFVTYEYTKAVLRTADSPYFSPIIHMMAASFGEIEAAWLSDPEPALPTEGPRWLAISLQPRESFHRLLTKYYPFNVQFWLTNSFKSEIKLRKSIGSVFIINIVNFLEAITLSSGIPGLYRGYKSTVLREIPFSLVQFPVWESLKELWSWKQGHVVDSWQSAVCGAFAGGFAAAVTTPLDVAKTRIMLAKTGSRTASGNVLSALQGVWKTQGISGLFAGIVPRISSISLGGFIFLGMYDKIRSLLL
ncbi:PREDICTED: S-adenosylmethionine mitochondrial carrier protein [Thamnophis sirtalis]|uniref:Mitochondrial S-adenosylmethionine carrier protein n=1 Tax=Thamnophis sirtalis TaxID=35019 RepID=A0A6I9XXD1_9SAUR|nr:PREDICTED: S-adenosylmethionine mitochondrial carrier protein [Thamnophis sirtalis]